jgi:hypothetical protein
MTAAEWISAWPPPKSDRRGRRVTLGIEPVDWSWVDGEKVLARGGAGADRPVVNAR